MGDAVRGAQGKFRFREQLDDLFQVPPRRLAVLRDFQVPIRQRVEGEGDVLRRVAGLGAEALDGEFRSGQVLEVLGLNLRQQQLAFHVGGETVELLADFGHRLEVFAPLLVGLGDRIGRVRDRLLAAAVVEGGNRLGDQVGDVVPPDDGQHEPAPPPPAALQ